MISIKRENQQFKRILNQFTPNIIISDNRYGVFSSSIRSVFITHQLNILTGAGNIADSIAKIATHRLIKRFDECWVPDFAGSFNLAGLLSHPMPLPSFPIRYIGGLSRFSSCQDNADTMKSDTGSEIKILVILSGPEPQRTILERLLVKQLSALPAKVILVRGVQDNQALPVVGANIELINFADSRKLNQLICDAGLVICRSGYTSVMDLVKLGKKSILIPTPGQAEQEYLGRYLSGKKLAVIVQQQDLKSQDQPLKGAIVSAMSLEPVQAGCMEDYKQTIRELAASL